MITDFFNTMVDKTAINHVDTKHVNGLKPYFYENQEEINGFVSMSGSAL